MVRLIPFFLFLFFYGTTLALAMGGQTSLANTSLTAATTHSDATLYVASTTGFINNPVIYIENEEIYCSGKTATSFTGCDRGTGSTNASGHLAGKLVYNEATGVINQIIGYNVVKIFADDGLFKGLWATITTLPSMLVNAFQKLILWDWPFFEGYAMWMKIGMYIISASLVTSLLLLVFKRG